MEPVSLQEIVTLFKDWQKKLKHAIEIKDGSALSEGTRVVLSYVWILWKDSPDSLTPEMFAHIKHLFTMALSCIDEELEKGNDRDGCYNLYKLYISKRLQEINVIAEDESSLDGTKDKDSRHRKKTLAGFRNKSESRSLEIIIGAEVIGLILVSGALVFLLFQSFSDYSLHLNVIFSIVVVTLICLLLQVYNPDTIRKALRIYKDIAKKGRNMDIEKD